MRTKRDKRRKLLLEDLESRQMLTASIYVDFGLGLPGNNLTLTADDLRQDFSAGDPDSIGGPDLLGFRIGQAGPTIAANTNIRVTPNAMANSGVFRGGVIQKMQEHFDPFDAAIVAVASDDLQEMHNWLASDGDQEEDIYLLAANIEAQHPTTGAFHEIRAPEGFLFDGIAPLPDIVAQSNDRFDTVLLTLNVTEAVYTFPSNASAANTVGQIASHEAGHALGIPHVESPTQNPLVDDSDIMQPGTEFTRPDDTDNHDFFFSRVPLPISNGSINPSVHLEQQIGFRSQVEHWVTGTGADDLIEVYSFNFWGGPLINIRVTPDGYSSPIFSEVLSGSTSTLHILAGAGNDTIEYSDDVHQLLDIVVDGNSGDDSLVLEQDSTLVPGDALWSPNGDFQLVMQTDGNLVLYNMAGGTPVPTWHSQTPGQAVTHAIIQSDGNFVIYNGATPIWHSHTYGNNGAFLSLNDAGVFAVATQSNAQLWGSDRTLVSQLNLGQSAISPFGKYLLALQSDGNLVLYNQETATAVWHTQTAGFTPTHAVMQGDGNFVLYDNSTPLWHSQTFGNPGAELVLDDLGLRVLSASGSVLWSVA